MEERSGFGVLGLALAFLGGAAAGAAVALLAAPASGEETRERLLELANAQKEKATRVPKALKSAYAQASTAAKDGFAETYKNGTT